VNPPPTPTPTDDQVAAVALAGLPAMTPARLRHLLAGCGSPTAAADAVARGRAAPVLAPHTAVRHRDRLATDAAAWPERLDLAATGATMLRRGARAWLTDDRHYPVLDPLPHRPSVLVAEGARPDALDQPRVAIVGTRAATPHGLADAHELAGTLADAGVTIVSGLALGIDGAAHAGAVDAGGCTVGVVATGLDVEYPRRHRRLYHDVRAHGLVLGETGYGVRPDPTRFPVRNRIIAALADVVVVVEATLTGGARITADHALTYQRPVFAVPGSRRNPAAAGTNALIADGAHPCTDWTDLLLALGLTPAARRAPAARLAPDDDGTTILGALGGEPATPEQIATRTHLDPGRVAAALATLQRTGWVSLDRGVVWPA